MSRTMLITHSLAWISLFFSVPLNAESPTSGAEAPIQKLTRVFEGRWSVTEKHEPSEWSPAGAKGTGKAEFRAGPGRLSLIQEYRSSSSMGDFTGHGISWWDAEAAGFRGMWCENRSPSGCEDSGLVMWSGDRLTTVYKVKANGQETTVSRTVTIIDPDHFIVRFEMAIGENPMRPAMEIDYQRLR